MSALAEEKAVTLRKVTLADTETLLEWEQDAQCQAATEADQELTPEFISKYVKYLAEEAETKRLQVSRIIEAGGKGVGTVDVYFRSDEFPEIGVNVCKAERGKGYGTAGVKAMCKLMEAQGEVCLIARVQQGNAESSRVFAKAGFQRLEVKNDFELWIWAV